MTCHHGKLDGCAVCEEIADLKQFHAAYVDETKSILQAAKAENDRLRADRDALAERLKEVMAQSQAAYDCAYKLTATLTQLPPVMEKHEREFLSRTAVMDAVFRWRRDHDAALAREEKSNG